MRLGALLPVLAWLAACGSSSAAASDGGVADAVIACGTLADQSPVGRLVCPGLQTCTECQTGDAGGGAIVDGTYGLVESVIWASGCGIFNADEVHATLQVKDGTMQVVYTGPSDFSNAMATFRATYAYSADAGQLRLRAVCPGGFSPTFPQPYVARDPWLTVEVPEVPGVASFRRLQP
jgi:hypothetical protein